MKYYFLVLCGLAWLFCCEPSIGQQLDAISSFKLVYWRAFNGEIEMTILRPPDGQIALNTDVTTSDENGKKDTKHIVKMVSESDLLPVLKLINEEKNRKAFLKTPRRMMADGSALSLTVSENGFSLGFNCQVPFDKDAPEQVKAMAQVAKYLFHLADLNIPDKELY